MPLIRIIAAVVITLLSSVVAFSSCLQIVPASPARDFENAQAVFRGRVTNVGFHWFYRRVVPITFEVEQSWKGVDSNRVVVYTDTSSLGYLFESGETYIVYSSRDNGTFYTSQCSGTSMVRNAAAQLNDLSGRSLIPITRSVSNSKAKVVTITVGVVLLLLGIAYGVHKSMKRTA